jgi:hypothetical protein
MYADIENEGFELSGDEADMVEGYSRSRAQASSSLLRLSVAHGGGRSTMIM